MRPRRTNPLWMSWTDRIGKQVQIGPWWFRLSLGWHPACWYGVFYVARKRLWLRPIDCKAIDDYA